MRRKRVIIVGAAGRDFHNFNCLFREDPRYEVVAFTAEQIPGIEGRVYPPELAGPHYPDGIPIRPEGELEELIRRHGVEEIVYALSDVSDEEVMAKAARANAAGADFRLVGVAATQLPVARPSVSVCAVRTGCGKSATSRRVAAVLRTLGYRPVVVRHPMPYGDLRQQRVQRFASLRDLDRAHCTLEEREEFEPHIEAGSVVYAGVDYAEVFRRAAEDGDIILWDGGNNDTPFLKSDLEIVLVDPHRPGHELRYYPGQTNFRRAHCLVITKVGTAPPRGLQTVRENIRRLRPEATVIEADLVMRLEGDLELRGKTVLVVEDGPTLTHGEMPYGAGTLLARERGARLADPRPYLTGSLRETYGRYPHLAEALPAVGYGEAQIRELEATLRATPADLVLVATPVDLRRLLNVGKPVCRVRYELAERGKPDLEAVLAERFGRRG